MYHTLHAVPYQHLPHHLTWLVYFVMVRCPFWEFPNGCVKKKIINYVLKILIPCLGLNRDVFEVHAFALIQELFVSHADYIPFCLFQGQTWPLLKYCEKSTFYRPLKTYRFHQNRRCLRTSWCFRLTRIAKNTKPLLTAEQFSSYCFTFYQIKTVTDTSWFDIRIIQSNKMCSHFIFLVTR